MQPRSLIEALRVRGTERANGRAFLFLDSHGSEAVDLRIGELDAEEILDRIDDLSEGEMDALLAKLATAEEEMEA